MHELLRMNDNQTGKVCENLCDTININYSENISFKERFINEKKLCRDAKNRRS